MNSHKLVKKVTQMYIYVIKSPKLMEKESHKKINLWDKNSQASKKQ